MRLRLTITACRWLLAALALALFLIALSHPEFVHLAKGRVMPPWLLQVRLCVPRALVIDALLLGLVAVTLPWWLRGGTGFQPVGASSSPQNPKARTPFLLTLAVLTTCLIATLIQTAPRLSQSLWCDEEWSMRRSMVGEYRVDKTDQLKFYPVSWLQSLWDYRTPNNHAVYSVLAKASHTVLYQPSSDPGELYFSTFALRLPALLSALAALFLVWALLAELGLPRAGLIAAALLALHPWFVRYASEARGYGLLFSLWPLAVLLLLRGLRTGQWRWWLGYGVCQALLLCTWILQIHWLVALNAFAVLTLWQRRADDTASAQPRRWLLSCLLGAAITLPVLLPAVPQLQAWLSTGRAQGGSSQWPWLMDSLSFLFSGQSWSTADDPAILWQGRDVDWATHGLRLALQLGVVAALFSLGVSVFARGTARHRWLLVAMLLPMGSIFIHGTLASSVLLAWYAAPCLPAFAMLVAVGIDRLATTVPPRAYAFAALLGLAVPCTLWQPINSILRSHDIEPNLAATRLTRTVLNPRLIDLQHDPITVQFCLTRPGYDPASIEIETRSELDQLIAQARREARPLLVNLGNPKLARDRWPDIMSLLNDPGTFENIATLGGLDHAQTRQVWRLR